MLRGPGCAPHPQTGSDSDERRGSQWDHPSPRHGVERGRREVFIPLRNRFYEAWNELTENSEESVENLRVQHILNAITLDLIKIPDDVMLYIDMYGTAEYETLT